MTAVVFKFVHPDGTPVVDTPFVVSLRKTSFDEKLDVGILLPGDVQGMTDAQGMDTLELMPGFGIFYLTMSALGAAEDSDGCVSGLRYRFQVPESDTPVRVEDIIVTTPTFSRPWDETALQVIIDAKIESKQSADAAKASELAAGEFAVRAEDAVAATGENADAAAASALAASQSATTAGDASTAAITARNEAEGFRDQSRTSELAAAGSAATATEQAGLASQEKLQAQEYAEQSESSAGDAEVARVASVAASEASAASATQADAAAVLTAQDKQATAADRVAVTGLKADVVGLKDETKTYRDEALAAVGTITGAFVDGGLVDLSGGAYPPKPDVSTIWKVQVGGTVTTVKEGTIVYATGDQLVYTKTQDTWYKNVSQSAVTKVAGKTGDVVLEKGDVGLALVDNTADVDKPISTAQQAAFDARTPTTSRVDTTAGRLVKVGDYGENGGAAMLKSAADDANAITVPGTYVFNGGGLNLPENTVYIKHFNHATAGYSKQIAYGLQTNKVFTRTLNNGVWTDWGPAVEIVDSLTSSDPAKALSARQGKILLELLQANNATLIRYTFNVAAGQTTITGNSLEGVPLSYVPGVPFMVEKDGFPIWSGNDYTASNGSSITLVEASTVASQVAITVFGAFSVADHYTKGQTDVLLQNVAAQSAEALLTVKWVPSRDMVGLGTVPLDGGTYSRATYPDAWALIRDGKVPKVTDAAWLSTASNRGSFTEGDGSTTFRVPDYNGKSASAAGSVFIRGDGLYSGLSGIIQGSQNKPHTHPYTGSQYYSGQTGGSSSQYGTTASTTPVFTYNTGPDSSGGTDPESRPINVAGVWTIRLFGSVSNVGNIDVAQIAAQLNTLDNAAYKKTNIVGPVSQTGGVPTGAIIESGSNANGRYIKYADGTMICTRKDTYTGHNITGAYGSMFNGQAVPAVNYAQAFIATPVTSQTMTAEGAVCIAGSNGTATATVWPAVFPLAAISYSGAAITMDRIAIGRWY